MTDKNIGGDRGPEAAHVSSVRIGDIVEMRSDGSMRLVTEGAIGAGEGLFNAVKMLDDGHVVKYHGTERISNVARIADHVDFEAVVRLVVESMISDDGTAIMEESRVREIMNGRLEKEQGS